MRVGVLGAGNIVERAMVEPSRVLQDVEIAAIGSRDPERARTLAEKLGVEAHGDYSAVLSRDDIDLVYIVLPPTVHEMWAVRALEAGRHVLLEKPLAGNATASAVIADAAERTGRRAFVGFHYRLHPFTQHLVEALSPTVLGPASRVEIDFSIPHFVVKPGNIRLDGDLGGGALMDVGCYAIDLVRAIWGEPEVVRAEAIHYEGDPRVDMQTDAVLRVSGGGEVRLRASFLGDDAGAMTLRASGGVAEAVATSVIVPQWGATLRVTRGGELVESHDADPADNSYASQLAHLRDVLRDASPSVLDASHGVGTMRVLDAIYRAAGLQPR